MAASSKDVGSGVAGYKELLRDVYNSEELKIESKRCKAISNTIDALCRVNNTDFSALYEVVRKEIYQRKKELSAKHKSCQAAYMYQAERLPVVLQQLGKEEEGSMNDSILWQVRIHVCLIQDNQCIMCCTPVDDCG